MQNCPGAVLLEPKVKIMAVKPSDIKALRERTGAGMLDCKKALSVSGGDISKAVGQLRKQGLASAGKKAGRVAAEGAVCACVAEDKKSGALLELNCETDFVAKTGDFSGLASALAEQVLNGSPRDIDALLELSNTGKSMGDLVKETISKTGENISPRRFERFDGESSVVHSYIHGGGSLGVLVEISLEDEAIKSQPAFTEFCADVAMQVAASAPFYLSREDVPASEVTAEIEIYKEQLRKQGKKDELLDRIAKGKLEKFYQDVCLVDQPFVKESKTKVRDLVKAKSSELGSQISILRFSRFVLGEGIEKKQESFVEEVSAVVKG
jgi:elongation factor Ts